MDLWHRTVKMKVNGLNCFMLLLMMMDLCDASRFSQLKKFPLKSIKSKDGDVIDCVYIYQQPAFDHPLLKNHTIQMKPSYHPEGLKKLYYIKSNSDNDKQPITQIWQLNGRCPKGTIPIRRDKKEGGFTATSLIKSFLEKDKTRTNSKKLSAGKELIKQVKSYQPAAFRRIGDEFHGAKAIMNVWQPQLQQPNECSSSQLGILGGHSSNLNTIQAGWHVNQELYGDKRTRLFIHWTKDNFTSTGCYNLLCSGFVQTTNEIALGSALFPISNFNGSQSDISILMWKDSVQDAWWLEFGNITVGYWPVSLFTYLANYGRMIELSALVPNKESPAGLQTTDQMGSEHFPEEGFRRACYMRNLQLLDSSMKFKPFYFPRTLYPESNCHGIKIGSNVDWGNFIFFGGPGRNDNCP